MVYLCPVNDKLGACLIYKNKKVYQTFFLNWNSPFPEWSFQVSDEDRFLWQFSSHFLAEANHSPRTASPMSGRSVPQTAYSSSCNENLLELISWVLARQSSMPWTPRSRRHLSHSVGLSYSVGGGGWGLPEKQVEKGKQDQAESCQGLFNGG